MNNKDSQKKRPGPEDDSNIDPDFEIREANSGSPEFVGGTKKFSDDDSDDLEIESPVTSADDSFRTSGSADYSSYVGPETHPVSASKNTESESSLDISDQKDSRSDQKKSLSSSQISEIKNKLYNTDLYLSEKEKENLLANIGSSPESSAGDESTYKTTVSEQLLQKPSSQPVSVSPKMAPRTRGIAYFWNNYIQIVGAHGLKSGSSISFDDREYTLHRKTINKKSVYPRTNLFTWIVFRRHPGLRKLGPRFSRTRLTVSRNNLLRASRAVSRLCLAIKSFKNFFIGFE